MLGEILEVIGAIFDPLERDDKASKKDNALQLISIAVFLTCLVLLVILANWPLIQSGNAILKILAISLSFTLIICYFLYRVHILRNILFTTLLFFILALMIMLFTTLVLLSPQIAN